MAKSVKISIEGTSKARRFINKKKDRVYDLEQKGLKKAAIFVQGKVKSSIAGHEAEPTSVDAGRFLNSVDFTVGKNDAIVFSDVEYAKFLEKGTSKLGARRHFQNSAARSKNKVKQIMSNEIKNI